MKSDTPANRTLLNMTLLAILAPLYAVVLFTPEMGVLRRLAACWSQGTPLAAPLLYVLALGYLASIAWLLRRGTFVGPIIILLITMCANMIIAGSSRTGKVYELSIGTGRPMLGIDVYCNDVHLGKTPLNISEVEFNKLVKPWDTPPDQPMMILDEDDDRDRYSWAKFFYVPQDIFEMYKQWPPDHQRYSRHNDKETLEDFKSSRYWWRFEKYGCVGLTSLSGFSSGSGGSDGRITIDVNPSITLLSAERHLDALIAQLRADNLQPAKVWLDHFMRYKALLFPNFYAKAKSDNTLRPTLDAIVRAEFDIPAVPSESDCRRVVEEIVRRADKSRCFTVPSLESLAIEMVAKAHSQPIVDRFIELANLPQGGSNGRGWTDTWTTYRRSGPRAGLLPLEHAVKTVAPPQLFDRLVYMSRKSRDMTLLGNYPRKELEWLFRDYLNGLERQGGRRRDWRIRDAIRMCTEISNPLLEEILRQFVRQNARQGVGSAEHIVRDFVKSRINDPASDQGELAAWVFHFAPIEDRTKIELLPQIRDPNVNHYLYNMVARNNRYYEDVIYRLATNPNPALDKFIVEAYNWYARPKGPGSWSTSMTHALVKTDTPEVRQFIKDKWNESAKVRSRTIDHIDSGSWQEAHMNWLVPMLPDLTDKNDRIRAARLLSRIDAPEAYELATKWSTDPDPDIAKAAADQLRTRDQRTAETKQQLAHAADLLTGKIKPDDLLPSPTPYKWNGAEYVCDNGPD